MSKIQQQEVRWHVAQMFSYLNLDEVERDTVMQILFSYIAESKSNIVKVFSLQTLAKLAGQDSNKKPVLMKKLKEMMKTSSPAVVNRCNKLIKKLEKQ